MSANGMPAHLLALFKSRPPLEFFPPPKKRKMPAYDGFADYVHLFESTPPPPILSFETPKEKRVRVKLEKISLQQDILKEKRESYNPNELPFLGGEMTSDPWRTMFVGRLSFEVTEKKLKKEFEVYGPIRKVRIISDPAKKPRGYGFIEYEDERDMKKAYKTSNGKKIEGWRVLLDVERGRTIPGWFPRRLGGGRGLPRGNLEKKDHTMMLPYGKDVTSQRDITREVVRDYGSRPPGRNFAREGTRGGREAAHWDRDFPRSRDAPRRRRSRSRSRDRRRSRSHERDTRRRNRSRSYEYGNGRDRSRERMRR